MLLSDRTQVLAIVGPTGTGKTDLGVMLAETFGGEILNADSRLVYRGLDVGTAKPSINQRRKVAHHLIDICEPSADFNLSQFLPLATDVIADIHSRGRLPIVVGGTGLYVWALMEGFVTPQVTPNWPLRKELTELADARGPSILFDELISLDPEATKYIDPRNVRRLVRAIEVCRATGLAFSDLRRKSKPEYDALILGIMMPRDTLYRRINQRVDRMLEEGFLQEISNLMSKGFDIQLPSFTALGYRELASHLDGKSTLCEAIDLTKRNTRRFAQRQGTWFKQADTRIHWLSHEPDLYRKAAETVDKFASRDGMYG